MAKRARVITRWERNVEASDPSETWGRLEVSLVEPAREMGWRRCVVDVSGLLKYMAVEQW